MLDITFDKNDIHFILLKEGIKTIIEHPIYYKGQIVISDLMAELTGHWKAHCDEGGWRVKNLADLEVFCSKAGFTVTKKGRATYISM